LYEHISHKALDELEGGYMAINFNWINFNFILIHPRLYFNWINF